MNRKDKEKAISELKEEFSRARGAVIAEYKGMTVEELTDFRGGLRELGIQYKVVKNTLARIASEGTPVAPVRDYFSGPVGIAFSHEDAVKVAKGIIRYSARNEKLKPVAAVVEGKLVDARELKAIAELPPREVLLSVLAGTMSAPLSKMAGALQATLSSFGHAMNALLAKKEKAS